MKKKMIFFFQNNFLWPPVTVSAAFVMKVGSKRDFSNFRFKFVCVFAIPSGFDECWHEHESKNGTYNLFHLNQSGLFMFSFSFDARNSMLSRYFERSEPIIIQTSIYFMQLVFVCGRLMDLSLFVLYKYRTNSRRCGSISILTQYWKKNAFTPAV